MINITTKELEIENELKKQLKQFIQMLCNKDVLFI